MHHGHRCTALCDRSYYTQHWHRAGYVSTGCSSLTSSRCRAAATAPAPQHLPDTLGRLAQLTSSIKPAGIWQLEPRARLRPVDGPAGTPPYIPPGPCAVAAVAAVAAVFPTPGGLIRPPVPPSLGLARFKHKPAGGPLKWLLWPTAAGWVALQWFAAAGSEGPATAAECPAWKAAEPRAELCHGSLHRDTHICTVSRSLPEKVQQVDMGEGAEAQGVRLRAIPATASLQLQGLACTGAFGNGLHACHCSRFYRAAQTPHVAAMTAPECSAKRPPPC